jgi:hypothetical protein
VTPPPRSRARGWSRCSSRSCLARFPELLALLLLAGCAVWSNDAVRITVTFAGASPAAWLENLTVVSGSDRYSWDALASGDSRSINLLPGEADDRRLAFLYTLNAQMLSWDGPPIPVGAGYRITIVVDAQGRITERHCLLPRSLD